jgi:hypothetical protein
MKIKIRVDESGSIQTEVLDAQGDACTRFSKDIEEILGIVENREFKNEYYQDSQADKEEVRE